MTWTYCLFFIQLISWGKILSCWRTAPIEEAFMPSQLHDAKLRA